MPEHWRDAAPVRDCRGVKKTDVTKRSARPL